MQIIKRNSVRLNVPVNMNITDGDVQVVLADEGYYVDISVSVMQMNRTS